MRNPRPRFLYKGGSSSGMNKTDTDTMEYGEKVAQELFDAQDGKYLRKVFRFFSEYREYFFKDLKSGKLGDWFGQFDADLSIYMIDKWGYTETLTWESKPADWKEVKLKNIVYMHVENADNHFDSNGFNIDTDRDKYKLDTFELFPQGYADRVERIYKRLYRKGYKD